MQKMSEKEVFVFWMQEVDGISAQCIFKEGHYVVNVKKGEVKKQKKFKAQFFPSFGMDIADHQESLKVAEELALEIEAEEVKK